MPASQLDQGPLLEGPLAHSFRGQRLLGLCLHGSQEKLLDPQGGHMSPHGHKTEPISPHATPGNSAQGSRHSGPKPGLPTAGEGWVTGQTGRVHTQGGRWHTARPWLGARTHSGPHDPLGRQSCLRSPLTHSPQGRQLTGERKRMSGPHPALPTERVGPGPGLGLRLTATLS